MMTRTVGNRRRTLSQKPSPPRGAAGARPLAELDTVSDEVDLVHRTPAGLLAHPIGGYVEVDVVVAVADQHQDDAVSRLSQTVDPDPERRVDHRGDDHGGGPPR